VPVIQAIQAILEIMDLVDQAETGELVDRLEILGLPAIAVGVVAVVADLVVHQIYYGVGVRIVPDILIVDYHFLLYMEKLLEIVEVRRLRVEPVGLVVPLVREAPV